MKPTRVSNGKDGYLLWWWAHHVTIPWLIGMGNETEDEGEAWRPHEAGWRLNEA